MSTSKFYKMQFRAKMRAHAFTPQLRAERGTLKGPSDDGGDGDAGGDDDVGTRKERSAGSPEQQAWVVYRPD